MPPPDNASNNAIPTETAAGGGRPSDVPSDNAANARLVEQASTATHEPKETTAHGRGSG